MKQGIEYEIFVELVYHALSQEKSYTHYTERNKKIIGSSGASHEIDVYWEFQYGTEIYRIAIECKDYNTNISKGKVTEFYGKINDIPSLDGGIMATKIGYQKGAKQFAKFYNIETYLIKKPEADDFEKDRILRIEIMMKLISTDYRDFKPEFDMEWMKKTYEIGTRIEIRGSGDTVLLIDNERGFNGTVNQYILLEDLNKTSITIDKYDRIKVIVDGILVDTLTGNKYKIKEFQIDKYTTESDSKIVIDGLELVDAIIKDVQSGDILFIKK